MLLDSKNIKTFILILVILGVADYIWLGMVSSQMYQNVVRNIQGSGLSVKIIPAIFAYFLMTLTIYLLVNNSDVNKRNAFKYGSVAGLIIYGIFNATNAAILKNWTTKVSLRDTMWGTLLFGTTTYLVAHTL